MSGNSCQVEKHLRQWSGFCRKRDPRRGGRPRRPGLPGGAGGFHRNGGVESPKARLPGFSLRLNVKRPGEMPLKGLQ